MKIIVQAKPNSKKAEIKHLWKDLVTKLDIYQIKVKSSPTKWKANEEIIEMLSNLFKKNKSQIKILKWQTSTTKLIEII